MKCSNCGKEVPEGKKFCGFCGTKIIPAITETPVKAQIIQSQSDVAKLEENTASAGKFRLPKWIMVEIGILALFAILLLGVLGLRMIVIEVVFLLIALMAVVPTILAMKKLQKAGLKTNLGSYMWQLLVWIILFIVLIVLVLFQGNNWFIDSLGAYILLLPLGIGLLNSIINLRQKSTLVHAILSGLPMLIFLILIFLPIKIHY